MGIVKMIWKCQRKPYHKNDQIPFHAFCFEAPDEATARVMMYNRSGSRDWLDPIRTSVWSDEEEWTAL